MVGDNTLPWIEQTDIGGIAVLQTLQKTSVIVAATVLENSSCEKTICLDRGV